MYACVCVCDQVCVKDHPAHSLTAQLCEYNSTLFDDCVFCFSLSMHSQLHKIRLKIETVATRLRVTILSFTSI